MQAYFLSAIRAKQTKLILTFLCSVLSIGTLSISAYSAELKTSTLNTLKTINTGNSALPADMAFSLSAMIEAPNTIVLMWEIEEGYYLYRKSLAFVETSSDITQPALIPEGITINDEFFGDVEVYYNKLLVRIPFESKSHSEIQLQLSYQGCAEIGYCYPVQQKLVILDISQ